VPERQIVYGMCDTTVSLDNKLEGISVS